MPYDLVQTDTEQPVYCGECTLDPRPYRWGKCCEQQGNQNGDEGSQDNKERDPRHSDPVNNFINLKLFVRKGRNPNAHLVDRKQLSVESQSESLPAPKDRLRDASTEQ